MEIEGWYMMFYDKCAGDHSFSNKVTLHTTIEKLFTSNYTQLNGIEAIKEINKFGGIYVLPENINNKLFQVMLFICNTNIIEEKYTVVGVNIEQLKQYIETNTKIPDEKILKDLCQYHMQYSNKTKNLLQVSTINSDYSDTSLTADIRQNIIKMALDKTGDVTDKMIEQPKFLNLKLFDYQKRSIYWMIDKEKNSKPVSYNINDEISFGDIHYDTIGHSFTIDKDRKKISFRGGALIDEVGLGKTIQTATVALLNPATNLSYTRNNSNKLHSRATLVICPNQLCGQWKRELESKVKENEDISIIAILTKTHYNKYTYQDLLDADFVIVSYTFLENRSFLDPWIKHLSPGKSYHKTTSFDRGTANKILDEMGKILVKDPCVILQPEPQLLLINWHRIIVDEMHEIYTLSKYNYMPNILPLFKANYKWCVSGTPFNKDSTCLLGMLEFTSGYENLHGPRIFLSKQIQNHLMTNFFRRNTNKSRIEEYKLPPLKESVVWLKFSRTERMIYQSFTTNKNNTKDNVFLRQLCCHPKIAEETKDLLANCKTLEDVEKMMVKHYANVMNKASKKIKDRQFKIKLVELKITIFELKRLKRLLKKKNYRVTVEGIELIDQEELNDVDYEEGEEKLDLSDLNLNDDDEDDEGTIVGRVPITITPENKNNMIKLVNKIEWESNRVVWEQLHQRVRNHKNYLIDEARDYEGKKTTFDFYNNVMERIKKTKNKVKNEDDDSDDEDNEMCGICLDIIPESDIGVTSCGHMYCYKCITETIKSSAKCPYCRKSLVAKDVYQVSYEKKNTNENDAAIIDKNSLINKVGTKLANLIYFLKKNDGHSIIFSQWDDLLNKVGEVLNEHGIKNVFCKGNVWTRDKAIREFNGNDKIKVIMLSSGSAASGTNLTKATQVILLDPVYGSYEFRKNTEGQAIGRAHRTGQTKEVNVVRFIIKDTIEEDIYKENSEEDKKHIVDINIFESTDESLTLTDDKVKEIETSAENSKKKKAIVSKANTQKNIVVSDSDSDIE